MPVSSTESSPARLLVIPLTDAPATRWLHIVIALALFVQVPVLLVSAPRAAAVTLVMAALTLWSLRRTRLATGKLYLTQGGWCLVDDAGACWRAPLHAVSMLPFACAMHLRRGFRRRWVVVTRADVGTGAWRALRRAINLYALRPGFQDRVRRRLQGVGEIQREEQPAALTPLQRTANHQLGHH